ncbi:MAG: hypothetical protein AVDCRST_MAG48-3704, partial [uncultured Friedmanniella sp.]
DRQSGDLHFALRADVWRSDRHPQ